jgi:hypothetical protein
MCSVFFVYALTVRVGVCLALRSPDCLLFFRHLGYPGGVPFSLRLR